MGRAEYHRSHTLPDNFRLAAEMRPVLGAEATDHTDSDPEESVHKDEDEDDHDLKKEAITTKSTSSNSNSGMVLHEHHHGDDANRPKRCGQGIRADFNRTVRRYWWSEMTNFNLKTVAVSFFLYFACIAPAITFGAIYEKSTHNWMGAVEMITATAWCGIVYALIGGQPMVRSRLNNGCLGDCRLVGLGQYLNF